MRALKKKKVEWSETTFFSLQGEKTEKKIGDGKERVRQKRSQIRMKARGELSLPLSRYVIIT